MLITGTVPNHLVWRVYYWFIRSKLTTNLSSTSISQSVDSSSPESSVEKYFRVYYGPLCQTVYKMVRSSAVAEDIVQDVFLKVWNNRTQLDEQKSVKAYLYRAAINTTLNYLEKTKPQTTLGDEYENQVGINTIDESVAYQETEQRIRAAIDTLPPKCKVVFTLSRFEEQSYAEIAQTLSISVKSVEKHMGKALKILREQLKDYFQSTL
ncbi:RNA polymerase sigma-70 factor [Tunicatimonas pelagia]|uniref:RNA polymerase sigma-70 factor n=1 Tax=Tunicatimonas pelagia TaxID=931531 RepID=UPI0026665D84|nr:RNA polymerase sigma-70 factor [Tunicatimonas pelagia]WKN41491.1 RNA polymerase sigma-70 factor [Tunicatimonas pelagia]